MAGLVETRTNDSLLTTTLANFEKKIQDQIFDDYPFLSWINGKLGRAMRGGSIKRMQRGGESIVVHLLYEQNSTVNSYAGAETLDTTLQEGHTIGRFNWKQYSGAIGITGLERRSNMGEAAMINLVEAKTNQTLMSLRDRMSVDSFGDGTGNNSKNLTGLEALVSDSTTVGGLSTSTFPWWKANTLVGGSFAAQGENQMRTMYNNISFGNDKPGMIFSDQTVIESFEKSQVGQRRYTSDKAQSVGFDNLLFKSTPVIFDRDCTAGVMYFLNDSYMSYVVHPDADMKPGPFVTPENQDVTTAQIIFQGNLTINNRRKLGFITAFTA